MILLVEIGAVVASLAVVAIAVATVRTMSRVDKSTDQISKLTAEIHRWVCQADALTREARETVVAARGVRSVAAHFLERLSHRSTLGRPATNGGSESE
jgi:hypothetical protein